MSRAGIYSMGNKMRTFLTLLIFLSLHSCQHPPYYQNKQVKKLSKVQVPNVDSIEVSKYYFAASQRRPFFHEVQDTLEMNMDIENKLITILANYPFQLPSLEKDPNLESIIDPKLRWKRRKLVQFLDGVGYQKTTIVPIVCYDVSFGPEKSAGGGIGFVSNTGNDRYNIAQEVYVAFYHEGSLIYLNEVVRYNQLIVPADTPITHEFPQAVLDTLMHMALEPLLKRMEKKQ